MSYGSLSRINGGTSVVAVFGNPVAHSRSPALHNHWISEAGIDAVYVALRLAPHDPVGTLKRLSDVGLIGANVTLPYKEAALKAADDATPAASGIGAANTLSVTPDGRLMASNTDAPGFVAALHEACPDWRPRDSKVCLLGAGGAARAIAVGLRDAGVRHLNLVNRSRTRADDLNKMLSLPSATVFNWNYVEDALRDADYVINATACGLSGENNLDLPLAVTSHSCCVIDTVYSPLRTKLMDMAESLERRTVDGLGMLVHQAALSFETWFGLKPDTKTGRQCLTDLMK